MRLFTIMLLLLTNYIYCWAVVKTGDLQVTTQPGVRVYVDREFAGTTDAFSNGIFIENLAAGEHAISADRSGFIIRIEKFTIKEGRTTEIVFDFEAPKSRVKDYTLYDDLLIKKGKGGIILRSRPLKATIKIDGRDYGITDLRVDRLTSGDHKIEFAYKGRKLSIVVDLKNEQVVRLKADFYRNIVLNLTELAAIEAAREFKSIMLYVPPGDFWIDRYEYPNLKGRQPKTNVSWHEASKLCELQGKRLCRSDEWQAACRGSQKYAYPYGDAYLKSRCYTGWSYLDGSATSGAHPDCVSDYGTFDMSGNLWEWTADSKMRGGSWDHYGPESSCGDEVEYYPANTISNLGFRCCRSNNKK